MRIDGRLLRYEASGAGPPVVLVPGLGGAARWWQTATEDLARDHRVIVPELPGFSYRVSEPRFRLADAPVVLGGLVERLGLGQASLVGHSYGALVCLGVAAVRPEAVRRLVLVAPPVRMASRKMVGNAVPLVRTFLSLPRPAALALVTDIASHAPTALLRAAGEVLAHDGDPGIDSEPPVPTLVVWGARDALVPVRGAGWVGRALPGARVRIIPGAGHVPMLDQPDLLNAELREFLTAP